MTGKGKHSENPSSPTGSALVKAGDQTQLDFELDFFQGILDRQPNHIDVLRVQGNNLTLKGRYAEGLQIDKKLALLRPEDPLVHYNLACSLSLLRKKEAAIKTLRRAIELGYRDFDYIRDDRDLDFVRSDPRFRQLLREFETR
jgi:Flp pilus assembly protein TadD